MFATFSITAAVALIVALIASYTDVRTGKIYNWLTFPAAVVGVIVRAIEFAMKNPNTAAASGMAGALDGALGWLVGVLIMTVTKFFLRQMGHGDSKLMGALGAFLGPANLVVVWFWYCITYGLYVLKMLAKLPWAKVPVAISTKNIQLIFDDEAFKASRKQVHPVAPLITAGLVLGLVFQKQTLLFFGLAK